MSKTWSLESGGERLIVEHFSLERKAAPWQRAVEPTIHLERWMRDPRVRPALLEMYRALGGREEREGTRLDDTRRLRARLESAFFHGELTLRYPPTLNMVMGGRRNGDPTSEPEGRSWVDITLIDQDDKPVEGARYVIRLRDGRTREGRTGSGGYARESDLEPGSVEVTFPDFERRMWDLA